MPFLRLFVSDATLARLEHFRDQMDAQGRSVEDLAESAIEEAALKAVPNLPAERKVRRC